MSDKEQASLDDGQQEMVQPQSNTSGVARQPQRASTSEDEEEDHASQEYLIPVLMGSSSQSAAPSTTKNNKSGIPHSAGDHNDDDDESRLFMSECSLSEDGDSVSRIRNPHQADPLRTGPVAGEQHDANVQRNGTFQSSSEEEMIHSGDYNENHRGRSSGETPSGTDPEQQQQNQHDRRAHTPDQGRRRSRHRQTYTPTLSPGNTSLSSWDASPAIQQKVLLQFVMPENKYEKQARLQRQKQQQKRPQQKSPDARVRLDMNSATGPSVQVVGARQRNQTGNSYHLDRGSSETGSFVEQTPGLNNNNDHAGKNREEDGNQANGGSRLPASDRMSADNFLRNLRVQSHGAVEEQDDLHTPLSMDDSFRQHQHGADQTEVDAVMRSHKDPRIFGSQNGNGNMKGLDSRHDDYDSVRGDVFLCRRQSLVLHETRRKIQWP